MLVFFALVLLPLLLMLLFVFQPGPFQRSCRIEIRSGQSLPQVARELERHQVVRNALAFRLLARLRGDSRLLQAGSYQFDPPLTPLQVLDKLVRGEVELVRCTLPEGLTAVETVERLVEAGLGRRERFLACLSDPDFLHQLKVSAATLEGYLFPETYAFAAGTPEAAVLETLVRQLFAKLDESLRQALAQRKLTLHQALTLASIVQKEAGCVEEMPRIAAVFHNRLARHMPLQADPTVIYGLKDFDGNLTRAHLRMDTPYNTYLHAGLPPGPIANPGLAALRAVLFPADESFLYFVAMGNGRHHFSRTLQEHNRAVRTYQLHR
ncbi:MAG: endolytic transglycosylase MltG [Desulfuromonadaceae bacterium]|nr:endolytic transglycosylase MltG [Desulfuromonadaceae bacterium]